MSQGKLRDNMRLGTQKLSDRVREKQRKDNRGREGGMIGVRNTTGRVVWRIMQSICCKAEITSTSAEA